MPTVSGSTNRSERATALLADALLDAPVASGGPQRDWAL
jgi:hypothetical protein